VKRERSTSPRRRPPGIETRTRFFSLTNAWLLIKEKFCEQEIEKECVFDRLRMKVLSVVLHKYELPKLVAADSNNLAQPEEQLLEHPVVNIPIPTGSRFRYEQYLDTSTNAKPSNNHDRSLDPRTWECVRRRHGSRAAG
jgi:hypothetical protein